MRHSRLWTGLSTLFSCLLVLLLVGLDCMNGYAGTINQFLGIKTSKIVNEGSATENQIYYESEYGEYECGESSEAGRRHPMRRLCWKRRRERFF